MCFELGRKLMDRAGQFGGGGGASHIYSSPLGETLAATRFYCTLCILD